mmetsp:Transcript_39601/g.38152  ORF Transcript_39601/g.38152 Transcript_39601/m.38152 type:complete len:119 (+) Transcript_39601:271-627(+)
MEQDYNVTVDDITTLLPQSSLNYMNMSSFDVETQTVALQEVAQQLIEQNQTNLQVDILAAQQMLVEILQQTDPPEGITLNYTVMETFDESDGKFSNSLGNVALIDCHYLGQALETYFE